MLESVGCTRNLPTSALESVICTCNLPTLMLESVICTCNLPTLMLESVGCTCNLPASTEMTGDSKIHQGKPHHHRRTYLLRFADHVVFY